MYYEEMRASLREGKTEKLYIFQGEEDYLIEFMIDEIKKSLVDPMAEMMNFISFSELPPVREAADFWGIFPVMSERKLTVFRKCGLFSGNLKNKNQWESAFSDIPDYNCIIIWEEMPEKGKKAPPLRKIIEENGETVNFPLRSESQLRSWIIKMTAAHGKTIENSDASYIISSLGRKMRVIKAETDKIYAYSESKKITRQDIDAVIVKPQTETVFRLIDAMFEGRREACYNILYELKMLRQDPVSILSLLSGQIINIYKAKIYLLSSMTSSAAAAKIGGGYGAEKSVQKANKIKTENIEILIELCFEADRRIKKGLTDGWSALDVIIAEYHFY